MLQHEALAILQQAKLLGPHACDVAVGAERQRSRGLERSRQIAHTVAEIGFGSGAQQGAGSGGGHGADILQRRMHQRPPPVERDLARQPFDGLQAGRGQTLIHLACVFADVQVDRGCIASAGAREFVHRRRGGSAQRVDCHAGGDVAQLPPTDGVAQPQDPCHVGREPTLIGVLRRLRETGALVQRWQDREPHSGLVNGVRERLAHRSVIAPVREVLMTIPAEVPPQYETDAFFIDRTPWGGHRQFWDEITYRDPLNHHLHASIPGHRFDVALQRRNPRAIRRGSSDGTRAEGWAFWIEEMYLQAGLLQDRPRTRELFYIAQLKRAARIRAEVRMQTGEWSLAEAIRYLNAEVPADGGEPRAV